MEGRDAEALLEQIRAALEADTRFEIVDLVLELDPEAEFLAVGGRVDDIRAKRLAASRVVQIVNRQFAVRDRIRLRVGSQSQLELRDGVVRVLASEGMFSDYTIVVTTDSHREVVHRGTRDDGRLDVRIDKGVVALDGRVPSLAHRRFAEVLVWWVAGCERVDNALAVTSSERDEDDNELTDVVRMVLEKDPLVHATQLHIGTTGGVVAIEGGLSSEEERQLAVLDVWYVPGVSDVVDRIIV